MDMQLFDNYEDDGQLSLFGPEEPTEESAAEESAQDNGLNIRIGHCSSCGKLLFVREESDGFFSECNNCSIKYFQKK